MTDEKCTYPGCKDKTIGKIQLKELQNKEGKLNETGNKLEVSACQYHNMMLTSGMFGLMQRQNDPKNWDLYGPFDIIATTEIVILSTILSGRFNQLMKVHETVMQKNKDMENKIEEMRKKNEQKTDA